MKITENTLLPISLIVLIGGGIFWISAMWSQVQASSDEIKDIKTNQSKMSDDVINQNKEIIQRLTRIEERLAIQSSK